MCYNPTSSTITETIRENDIQDYDIFVLFVYFVCCWIMIFYLLK